MALVTAKLGCAAIDCVEADGSMGNMAVGRTHDVMVMGGRADRDEREGIATYARKLYGSDVNAWPSEIPFYFFAPNFTAELFSPGGVKIVVHDEFSDAVLARLVVYTVTVPFAPKYNALACMELAESPIEEIFRRLRVGTISSSPGTSIPVSGSKKARYLEHYGAVET
jgi:hypothetical protein